MARFFAQFHGLSDDVVIHVGSRTACVAACHTIHDAIADGGFTSAAIIAAVEPFLPYDVGGSYFNTTITQVPADGVPTRINRTTITENPKE